MGRAPANSFAPRRQGRAALCAALIPLLVLSNLSVEVFVSHTHGNGPAHTHATRALGVDASFLSRQIEHCHQHRESAPAPHNDHQHHGHGDETVISAADCQTTVVITSACSFVGRHQSSPKQLLHHLLPAAAIDGPAIHQPFHWPSRPARCHGDSPALAFDVVRCTVRLI